MQYSISAPCQTAALDSKADHRDRSVSRDQPFLTPSLRTWVLAGVVAIVCLVWVVRAGFSLTWPYDLWPLFYPVLVLIASQVYGKRRNRPRIRVICGAGISSMLFFVFYTATIAVLSYLVVPLNRPLYDSQLAQWDAALGFDWKTFLEWVNAHPLIGKTLTVTYHTLILQLVLLILALSITGNVPRLRELCDLYVMTSLVTVVLFAIFPAVGAYIYHAPDPAIFSNLNPKAGLWHIKHFEGLRNGTLKLVQFGQIQGLVTFPSFHTCFAMTLAWCFRDFKRFFPAAIALNAAVLVSTLSEGGHYLVDGLAGIVITIGCIGLRFVFVKRAPADMRARIL